MAVKYKIQKVNDPQYSNLYYARAVYTGQIDLDGIAEKIQDRCSLRKSDVKAVLDEFVETLKEELNDSRMVCVDGLGTFKMSIKNKASQRKKDVAGNILGYKVNFLPSYKRDINNKHVTYLTKETKAQEKRSKR